MEHPFVQFLVERELVPEPVARRLKRARPFRREPLGMIAVNHGLLSPDQIDEILDNQGKDNRRFGEIAVSLGFMTEEQVQTLLTIQDFRSASLFGEALALGGVLPCQEMARYLGAYLLKDQELVEIMTSASR
jgi:hypothetical protein